MPFTAKFNSLIYHILSVLKKFFWKKSLFSNLANGRCGKEKEGIKPGYFSMFFKKLKV